ncbi:hypothetical protein PR202_gb03559 [Eleusine coracana subsp. coracana]|uniref:Uncharacterized protein n=1 Tax=Eleusine coracana subsp. coracana TaxID=191504 RepID=A0AAV5E256_ELECO|nr:hypothetical protein PR202_gb03559 [Eleusine coracana subsp. coracana]
MRRVMAELKYLPEQPTSDDSELLFPIRKPVDDYNHSSGLQLGSQSHGNFSVLVFVDVVISGTNCVVSRGASV